MIFFSPNFNKAPIPIFILGPTMTEHLEFFSELSSDGGELCSNVTCLGKRVPSLVTFKCGCGVI